MAEKTGISWCDATFNGWWGCNKVSPACDNCYAERDAKRFAPGQVLWGVDSTRRLFGDKHWQAPLNWAKTMPAKLGRRPRIFSASMSDWLDLDAPMTEFIRLLDTIRLTPELDWLLLSKRVGNWRKRMEAAAAHLWDNPAGSDELTRWIMLWLRGEPPAHVQIGSTMVTQPEVDRDGPKLAAVPARVRFISIEPMLGAMDISKWLQLGRCQSRDGGDSSGPLRCGLPAGHDDDHTALIETGAKWLGVSGELQWVIAGGESGPKARPAHPDWFRSLRDQCAAAGVPFHFKQWGEWWEVDSDGRDEETGDHRVIEVPGIAASERFDPKTDCLIAPDGRAFRSLDGLPADVPCRHMTRLGTANAGRQLDGVEHNGFPEAA